MKLDELVINLELASRGWPAGRPWAISDAGNWHQNRHSRANILGMKAAMDAAGRIVVPKALRQALGLRPGQPLEIRASDGRLEIEIAPTAIR